MFFSAKCMTFAFLCPTVPIIVLPLTHGKVCSKRFNTPSGDMFQAIRLAGGHVISSNLLLEIALLNVCIFIVTQYALYVHLLLLFSELLL